MPSPVTSARSATHGVYASTSPPTVDVGPFTIVITGVNLKAAGTTAVFTVPTSRAFICTGAIAVVTAVTSGGAGVQNFSITESGGSRSMSLTQSSASTTPVANQTVFTSITPATGAPFSTAAAGTNVQVVVTTSHAGSSAVTGSVFVSGYYVQ